MDGVQRLGKPEQTLLVAHIGRVMVPIYLDRGTGKGVSVEGTGTLLDGGDRLYLVTAAHVLEGVEPNQLSTPAGRTLAAPVPWRSVRVVKPRDSSKPPDVAIVEFLSPATIQALRNTYLPLTLGRITRATPGSTFILAGFPEAKATISGNVLDQEPYVYFTTMLPEPPKDTKHPLNPMFDLFFSLGRAAWRSDGAREEVPRLQGTSGCTIWEIGAGGKFWSPDTALKAVGIQSSEKHGAWFRATNWLGGIFVLATVDSDAAYALAVRLIGEEQATMVFRGWGYTV